MLDPDELVRWAELYGHPEEWAKEAQRLHAENEHLHERLLRLRSECSVCEKCGHVQAEPNWCHKCNHRVKMPVWAQSLLAELQAAKDREQEAEDRLNAVIGGTS